tara:strand:+ start:1070 stop:2113 length:1044 start_codon:yes stop_codon:yes gene_type:complete
MSKKIKYKNLLNFTKKILIKAGLDKFSTFSVSTGLCETSLRGVESHGIRLLNHYVKSALLGRKNPRPKFRFTKKFPAITVLDADNAFGHAAGFKAVDYSIDVAKKTGVSLVAVKNSSHPGAMASITLRAARKGYMCLGFTHADSLMLSHNGKRPYFGTNPICFAVPRKEKEPYCLDMATSMISWNKLLVQKAKNKPLDDFFAANSKGLKTKNAHEAKSLLGAGSYKGFGLASLVEIFCGVYTGMNFGRDILPMYTSSMKKPRKLGQLYITFRVDAAVSKSIFLKRMQKMTHEIRKEPRRKKESVKLPNDNEIIKTKEQLKNGIIINRETVHNLVKLSKKFKTKIQFI